MPILSKQLDLFPADLLDREDLNTGDGRQWYAMYTMSRREKEFMRRLQSRKLSFYGPLIPKRFKSPAGRTRTSFIPLFSNYVFVFGSAEDRFDALATNCVSKCVPVLDGSQLTHDLRQFRELISLNVPLTPEARLTEGMRVRIRTGRFQGFEGTILRREGKTRLLIAVRFLQQGASILLEDCQVEEV